MTAPLLQIQALCKAYGRGRARHVVLKNVNLRLAAGEVAALVGESGSGKSTLGKIVMGLETADSGSIEFYGQDLDYRRSQRRKFRSDIQMIFQDPFASLNPAHKILYCLERPQKNFHGKKNLSEIEALLEKVGLDPQTILERYPHELSGGQRQRVCIARAMISQPKLIIADEPSSMLDVSLRLGILHTLRQLVETHKLSILFITHDLASARHIADRIIVLNKGHIVRQGSCEDVIHYPKDAYTTNLIRSISDPYKSLGQAPSYTSKSPSHTMVRKDLHP